MFDRPRCRDWTNLATQQLRLRNLIQITGHNIICDQKCSIYFTLHLTSMSAPFYTSEQVEPHRNIIWPEIINCPILMKSASKIICIRIWETKNSPPTTTTETTTTTSVATTTKDDKLLFLWGVYFSGLVPILNRSDIKLRDNSLIFQMHGGHFTSIGCLTLGMPVPNSIKSKNSQITFSSSAPSISPLAISDENYTKNILESRNMNYSNSSSNNTLKSCDVENDNVAVYNDEPVKNNIILTNSHISRSSNKLSPNNIITQSKLNGSKTNSPVNNFLDLFTTSSALATASLLPSAGTNIASSLPKNASQLVGHDTKQNATFENNLNHLKIRYLYMEFLKSEIRPSYKLNKLLLLQEKQRDIKYRSQSSKELIDRICMKSAYCLNLDLIANKSILYTTKVNPGMGRALSRLLNQQQTPPKPETILRAQELRRQIEKAKFRCRLLSQERDRARTHLRQIESKMNTLSDSNIDAESTIMSNYHRLSRIKEQACQYKITYVGQKDVLTNLRKLVAFRKQQLLIQLNEIYLIEKREDGKFLVNNLYLPNAESYNESVSPTELSVALGFAAHIVLMCSVISNIPLRNKIKYEGSRSKIIDNIKLLPHNEREFPLFCRTSPPPNQLLYAVFLLNQNISQLQFVLGMNRGNLRATLPNLYELLNGSIPELTRPTLFGDELVATSISASSSVDLNVVPIPLSLNLSSEKKLNTRISRSVDSSSVPRENKFTTNTKCNSEPILTLRHKQLNSYKKTNN